MFQLKRFFLIYGGLLFTAFIVLLVFLFLQSERFDVEKAGERKNLELSHYVSQQIKGEIEDYLLVLTRPADTNVIERNQTLRRLSEKINNFSHYTDILKIKIFKVDGEIIFSTVAEEIGRRNLDDVVNSLDGSPQSSLSFKTSMMTLGGEINNRYIVETYLPLVSDFGHTIAVVELYADVTEELIASRNNVMPYVIGLVIVIVVLFAFLYGLISKASKTIQEQYTRLNENNLLLEEAKKSLEYVVDARTFELQQTVENLETEIQRRSKAQGQLHKLAHFDTLTGLHNRFSLQDRLDQAIADHRRGADQIALMYMDLDRFKQVNDSMGHKAGDAVLIEIAARLKAICRRDSDIISRLGGDEFVLVFTRVESLSFVSLTADAVVSSLSLPIVYDGQDFVTTPSIGIAIYPEDGQTADELLKAADAAMYHVKEHGRCGYEFYSENILQAIEEKVLLEKDLRQAIQTNSLELYYQPKIAAKQTDEVLVEALLRWNHPEKGFVSPEVFVAIAEEFNIIKELGDWVLSEACQQLHAWQEKGYDPINVAINVSLNQLEENFVIRLKQQLANYALQPSQLSLEITESSAMEDPDCVIKILRQIRQVGVHIAVDDFGTGYSSLSYLTRLPVNTLKLDKSFVSDLENNADNATICSIAITMAHALGFEVVAEGVETAEQKNFLFDNGCDYLQGYYFSKPIPAAELEASVLQSAFK